MLVCASVVDKGLGDEDLTWADASLAKGVKHSDQHISTQLHMPPRKLWALVIWWRVMPDVVDGLTKLFTNASDLGLKELDTSPRC